MTPEEVIPRGEPLSLTFTIQEWKYISFACRQMARKRERETKNGKRPPPPDGIDANFVASVILNRAATRMYDACLGKEEGT